MSPGYAIESTDLTRRFGSLTAVDHIDLAIPRERIFGFLGPNGSGKSTTIRLLCGLLTPSEGQVSVLSYRIPEQAEVLKQKIGYMTQRFSLYEDLTVRVNLNFIAQIYCIGKTERRSRIEEALTTYRLKEMAHQLAGTLSGGQRQRLSLAAATLHRPELLLLDEPTSAVDPQTRRDFWDRLFDLVDGGTTILVSTHYMDEAERCHNLAILDHGRIVANGEPKTLMRDMDCDVVEVESDRPRKIARALADADNIVSVTQLGARQRVLVDKQQGEASAYVRQLLDTAGLQAVCHDAPPSLEDVFVTATRNTHLPGMS
jgi:ABC-2 type transport system ATP-binding protein